MTNSFLEWNKVTLTGKIARGMSPDFFLQKLGKECPISSENFQRDPLGGSTGISEKRGGGASTSSSTDEGYETHLQLVIVTMVLTMLFSARNSI